MVSARVPSRSVFTLLQVKCVVERNSRYSLRKEGCNLVTMTEGPSTFSKEAKEGFSRRVQSQAFLPVHIVRVKFQRNSLPDNLVHIAGYSREVPGVLEFYKMFVMNVCSATADVSGCPDRMCRWCSFFLVSIDRPICPMYMYSQSVLYTPIELSSKS